VLTRLGEPVEGEAPKITERRNEHLGLVAKAKKTIEEANALHDEVTKHRTTLEQRVIGNVLHSEKIEVSVGPHEYTNDWALIELYEKMIDWQSFKGKQGLRWYVFLYFQRFFHLSPFSSLVTFPPSVFLSSVLANYYFAFHYFSFLRRWQSFNRRLWQHNVPSPL
jgi:hypothetical protein